MRPQAASLWMFLAAFSCGDSASPLTSGIATNAPSQTSSMASSEPGTEEVTGLPPTTSTSMSATSETGESNTGSGDADTGGVTSIVTTGAEGGGPIIVSFQTNVSQLTEGESVTFTVVLTDPDGVDDIIGGTLSSADGSIGYGPFVVAGPPGTYSIELSWAEIHQAEPIEFEGTATGRTFRAEFFDQATHETSKDVDLELHCDGLAACDGVCTDLMSEPQHCGACARVCDGEDPACEGGECGPALSECFAMAEGFDTCAAYCPSVGETCVAEGCEGHTWIGYDNEAECVGFIDGYTSPDLCGTSIDWANFSMVARCCCTDTE